MALKKYKPTTPGLRWRTTSTFEEITKDKPEKSLLDKKTKTGGRNNMGRITSRFRGGGHKKRYRIIDWKRDLTGVPAVVEAIEYDPNRTARIMLLKYANGERRYSIAPDGIKVGDTIQSGPRLDMNIGNAMPIEDISVGAMIHNIEMKPGKGGQIARAAGAAARLMAKEGNYAQILLPSGEVRKIHVKCMATVGQVGNLEHENISWGKAGRNRWRGRRPHVRGSAMNPVDHPHGGGEGRCPIGRDPVSPWGQLAKGYKTRKKKKESSKWIVKRRK